MEWVDFNIRFFKSYDLGPCVHACIQFTNTSWDRVGPSVFGSNCVRKRKKKQTIILKRAQCYKPFADWDG